MDSYLLIMGRKSKFQRNLQHPVSNKIEVIPTDQNINLKRTSRHLSQRNSLTKNRTRSPLKIPIKVDLQI